MTEAEDMTLRRQSISKQLAFIVRGYEAPGLAGSVPSQIFESEPNSVLNRMFNGEWAYAQDDKGRALVNSDPAHWPQILNWLSFGAVPASPSPAFIAECRYWQLQNLLQALETADVRGSRFDKRDNHSFEVTPFHKDGRNGFRLEGHICQVVHRLEEATPICVPFSAYGTDWQFEIKKAGAQLNLMKGPPCKQPDVTIQFGPAHSQWVLISFSNCNFSAATKGYGGLLSAKQLLRLQHPPFMDLSGSLLVSISFLHRKPTDC